jgi:hypothetical protein
MRAPSLFCLWALALAGGCGRRDPTTVTVTLRIDDEVFRPEFVLLNWRLGNGRDLFGDVRLPDRGLLARQGPVLGSVEFEIEADLRGDRELQVRGVRDNQRVAGATAHIPWLAGNQQQVTLTLGCSGDLENAEVLAACSRVDPDSGPPSLPPPPDAGVDAARDALERPPEPPAGDPPTADSGPPDSAKGDAGAGDRGAGPDQTIASHDAGNPDGSPDTRPGPRDGAVDQRTVIAHPAPAGVDLTRGLLLYLRLDEGTPTATTRDGSGRQNLATLVNLDAAIAWIPGPLGGPALAFPGNPPGWVRITSTPALNEIREGFTLSAWVRTPATAGSVRRTIAARRSIGPGGFLYSLHLMGDRPGLYIHSTNGANANLVSPEALPPDTWVHLALVYDRTYAQLFVDGKIAAREMFQLSIGPENSPLCLGASEDVIPGQASDPLGGDLDEIAVYDHALGTAEIDALASGAQPPLR